MSAPAPAVSKPKLAVDRSGLPFHLGAPEGAAVMLANAFIGRSSGAFDMVCLAPMGGGENRKRYEQFLKRTRDSFPAEILRQTPSPGAPKTILKVYAARSLSQSGPASYGYAVFGFKDVKFVDVIVRLHDNSVIRNRTLVIQASDNKWYAMPDPDAYPLLSAGLNDEADSTVDFRDAYELVPR